MVNWFSASEKRWAAALVNKKQDFYHWPCYAELAAEHERGEAIAYAHEFSAGSLLIPLVVRSLPHELDPDRVLRDAVSPYGYAGPIYTEALPAEKMRTGLSEFIEQGRANGLISSFIRCHPLHNADIDRLTHGIPQIEAVLQGHTVSTDLRRSTVEFDSALRHNHHRNIRRLKDQGYRVEIDHWQDYPAFVDLHRETMQRVGAAEYYIFDRVYFEKLRDCLGAAMHLCTVRAPTNDVACGGIFTLVDDVIEYHLGGTSKAHLPAAPSKLMFYSIRHWGAETGAKILHLGGGVGGRKDTLYEFKRGFGTHVHEYFTVRVIHDLEVYQRLTRSSNVLCGNEASYPDYFPRYRAFTKKSRVDISGGSTIVGMNLPSNPVNNPGPVKNAVTANAQRFTANYAERAPWPVFSADELAAVTRVLRSGKVNYWTGHEVREFEREFAAACGARYGVALANGTVALELALKVLNVGVGDEVVVTPRGFFACASCVASVGATPVFADIDPNSQNIRAETIRPVITGKTRAIIAVHHAGWPCEMDGINALAAEYGIKVIEDCSQAHGAKYHGRPVGALADIGIFSFCQDKIMTTGGEGGILVTNDASVWETAWSAKDHGKNIAALHVTPPTTSFRWLHDHWGTNLRMTEMQAAIGRIQLRKLPEWVEKRRANAETLERILGGLDILRLPKPPRHIFHAYYRYYAFVEDVAVDDGRTRDRLLGTLRDAGVPSFVGSCPEIYREKAFIGTVSVPKRRLPVARALGDAGLCFLVHPTFTDTDMVDMAHTAATIVHVATSRRRPVSQAGNY